MQTKEKLNKIVLGKAQGSSRSCFGLLLLPYSLLQALSPGSTLPDKTEMWAKYWHKMGFHHPWVTVPKQGPLCLAGRAVRRDTLQFPLLKASGSELVCNLSQQRKPWGGKKDYGYPPSPQAEHIPSFPGCSTRSITPASSSWAVAATNPTDARDFKPLLEKISCLLFCLAPSPAEMPQQLAASRAGRLTHAMQNVRSPWDSLQDFQCQPRASNRARKSCRQGAVLPWCSAGDLSMTQCRSGLHPFQRVQGKERVKRAALLIGKR